jgi:hypothetical protein
VQTWSQTDDGEPTVGSLRPASDKRPGKRKPSARRARQESLDQWGTGLYELLQVSPTASPEVVRAAYEVLARRYTQNSEDPTSPRSIAALQAAYEILSDAECRAAYDKANAATGHGLGSISAVRHDGERNTAIRNHAFGRGEIAPAQPTTRLPGAAVILLAVASAVIVVLGLIAYAVSG